MSTRMHRFFHFRQLTAMACLVVSSACFDAESDPDDTPSTSTPASDDSTMTPDDETNPPWVACGEAASCLPVPPEEWSIYAALWHEPLSGDVEPTAPDCPAEFPRQRMSLAAFDGDQVAYVGVACLGNPIDAEGCPSEGAINCVAHPPSPFEYNVCALWSAGASDCPSDTPFRAQYIFALDRDPEHLITFCCIEH